ncbi:unnamed protein product, partial [Symbiodinium sp. CCMP2592]
ECGIYLLPWIIDKSVITIPELLQAHFSEESWPSTSAVVLRLEQCSGRRLSWTDVDAACKGEACGPVRASYRVSGFIWHGNAHYVAYLVCGRQWYCLNDAVISEVGVGDLPSEACLVFMEKTMRRKGSSGESSDAALCRLCVGQFARRVALQRAIRIGKPLDKLGPGRNQSGRKQHQERAGRNNQERAGRNQERAGRNQERAGRNQERAGRNQERSGRNQERSGRNQERSGRNERSGLNQERSGRNKERQRQDEVFSARAWSSNLDGGRGDQANEADNPFKRFQHASRLHVREGKEKLMMWPQKPLQMAEQPCLLCDGVGFAVREELLAHIDEMHGGLQRYRNAYLHLESLCPHIVAGSEVRHYVSNYAEFLRRSAMDWEASALSCARERIGCAFCARCFWRESMQECFLKGPKCCMAAAETVWEMLSVKRYHERWPLIPTKELEASSVDVGTARCPVLVLLHKRRVTGDMVRGNAPAAVCEDCVEAFSGRKPWLCKYALANDLWLGRPDPLLWKANMTHEMCLALARTVATKVVLRAGGASQAESSNRPSNSWDYVFQQSGLVGSAVVFHNGDAEYALESLPPTKLNDALAVSFCVDLPSAGMQEQSRAAVSRIARLQLHKEEFVQQAEALRETNPVYRSGVDEINRELLAEWFSSEDLFVCQCCLVWTGPARFGKPGQRRQLKLPETCVLAMEPQVEDFNSRGREISMLVVSMLQKLEELQDAGARSVALEMETMVDEQRTLVDHLGRQHILELCRQIHESCRQLSAAEKQSRLERELRDAVMGKSRWLNASEAALAPRVAEQEDDRPAPEEADHVHGDAAEEDGQAAHLLVARGKQPLSLWDWKIWTMAKPRLWRYGDAGNLFERDTNLSTSEWAACLLLREELAYAVDGELDEGDAALRPVLGSQPASDPSEAVRPVLGTQPAQNRFSGDWTALHMMATVSRLTDQRAAAYNFLKNGGMAFAKKLRELSAEDLASAARAAPQAGGTDQFFKEAAVPQTVKDALHAMNAASATVLGTDGHRRLCRREGVAYMEAFGPPLIFLTPNVADTQHPLLLVVQGEVVDLGAVSGDMETVLPKYRDMLRRLAQDPVALTVQFELLMRLFFQHVLNVRPDTLDCRRNAPRRGAREWCSDGVAAASTGAGMLGPILAFRGEIEAQGRGSLHPHILVWLVCRHMQVVSDLARMLREEKHVLQERLRTFMRMTVASFESIAHASVQAAPRIFGDLDAGRPVPVSSVAGNLCKYDGGCDLDLLREMTDLSEDQQRFLSASSEEAWRRPEMHLEDSTGGASSIFSTPINCLPVAQTPGYRLRSVLAAEADPTADADAWQLAFFQDLHDLAPSLLKHMCSESCYKYSDSSATRWKICRHGYYHVVFLCEGCRARRKGKPLRPVIHIGSAAEMEFGSAGKMRPIQLTPFEVQTCYGGTVAGRHNLDVQDMRRVLDPALWLRASERLPQIAGPAKQLGYMAEYEWNGTEYESRSPFSAVSVSWASRRRLAAGFREDWLQAHRGRKSRDESRDPYWEADTAGNTSSSSSSSSSEADGEIDLDKAIRCGISEAFADGINSGFYVNRLWALVTVLQVIGDRMLEWK